MFPDFFADVPTISVVDPLAEVLGAAVSGRMDYHYADAVRLAGHSCPTVAGAWLMARRGLGALYPDGLPVRGQVRVELRDDLSSGTTGVVAAVLGLVIGAAGEGGFKGLGGRFARNCLVTGGVAMAGEVRLTRLDTGAQVELTYQAQSVPPDPVMLPLMQRVTKGEADADERRVFAGLWQDRVRRLLIEHADDPAVVRLIG